MKRKWKGIAVSIMGVCLIAAGAVSLYNCRSNMQAGDFTGDGTFRVAGTKIIDPDGKEFLIKGINVNGPGWCFPRDTLQDIDLIADAWRFNTVRLCAATKWDVWAKDYNSDLDTLVKAFTKKNIVIILELHDYTGIYPPLKDDGGYTLPNTDTIRPLSHLVTWWVDKAERFKNNTNVWFNIMNEPGPDNSKDSSDLWLSVHETVIKAIRKTGANNIIVLDEHGWGQGSGYFGGASSYDSAIIRMGPALNKKYNNLAYSLHVYDAWRDGFSRFNQYFNDAKSLGLCVILGEFGAGKENISQYNAIKNMYNSAISNNIGRIYWAWDDSGLPLTNDGCGWKIDKTNGDKPGNLNWPGEMVWLDNRGLLTAPVPDYNLNIPLLDNVDFENGYPSGWSNWGGCSIQGGVSHNGSKALVVSAGTSGGGGCPLELKANTTYRFSAWGKNAADAGVKYRPDPNNAYEQHHNVSFTSAVWERKSITFTTPGELYGATLFIWKNNSAVTFYLDDLELIEID
ncbi:MAG: cellulase family glycosylhydrolase [Treponema sp.]|jgi:hypothetical protein|nr:cellulase family glycosylhydrolase [Treponema sp.]